MYKGILKTREGKKIVAVKVLRVNSSLYVCYLNPLLEFCSKTKLFERVKNCQTTEMQMIISVLNRFTLKKGP